MRSKAKSNLLKNLAAALSIEIVENNSAKTCSTAKQDKYTNFDKKNQQYEAILDCLLDRFRRQIPPPKEYLRLLLKYFEQYYEKSPNIIHIERARQHGTAIGRVNVAGDTHGQFKDFLQIFRTDVGGSYPSNLNSYVFNGDIVDRGDSAVEIITLLLTLKLFNKNSVHILRGNHEDIDLNADYGFKDEVMDKYNKDESIYSLFSNLFAVLPVGAVIENQVFVVHGGLCCRTYKLTIAELNKFNRKKEAIYEDHILNGLLWRDLAEIEGEFAFRPGRGRERSQVFGQKATEHFLNINNLKLLIRSHECVEGIAFHHNRKCITVFSAPNYCGEVGNKGAIVRFEAGGGKELEPKFVYFYAARKIDSVPSKNKSPLNTPIKGKVEDDSVFIAPWTPLRTSRTISESLFYSADSKSQQEFEPTQQSSNATSHAVVTNASTRVGDVSIDAQRVMESDSIICFEVIFKVIHHWFSCW